MFCKKCGARINDEDNVCPKCGVSLDTQLSNESTKNLEDEFEELLKPDVQTTTNEEIIWQEAPEVGTIDLPTDSSPELNNSQEVQNNVIPSMSSEIVKNVTETKNASQQDEEKITQTEIKETNELKDDASVISKESGSSEEEVTTDIEENVEEVETISTDVVEDDIVVDDMIIDDFILDDSSEVVFEDLNAESTEEVEIQDEVIEPIVEDASESEDVDVIEPEIEEEIIEEKVSEPVVDEVPESEVDEEVAEPVVNIPESDVGEEDSEPVVEEVIEPESKNLTKESSAEEKPKLSVIEETESESSVNDDVKETVIEPESEPKVIESISQSEYEYTSTATDEDEDEDIKSKFNKKLTSDDELDEFDYDLDENVNNLTSKFTTVIIIILILVIAVIIATLLFQNLGL